MMILSKEFKRKKIGIPDYIEKPEKPYIRNSLLLQLQILSYGEETYFTA